MSERQPECGVPDPRRERPGIAELSFTAFLIAALLYVQTPKKPAPEMGNPAQYAQELTKQLQLSSDTSQ